MSENETNAELENEQPTQETETPDVESYSEQELASLNSDPPTPGGGGGFISDPPTPGGGGGNA